MTFGCSHCLDLGCGALPGEHLAVFTGMSHTIERASLANRFSLIAHSPCRGGMEIEASCQEGKLEHIESERQGLSARSEPRSICA